MKRCILFAAALALAAVSSFGCRKTEVVGAAPERVVSPTPTVVEHHDGGAVIIDK